MAVEQYFSSPLSHYDPADLLDALATGIVVLDAQLCVVYANVAAQGLLAMSFNQARGRPVQDMFIECNGLVATLRRALRMKSSPKAASINTLPGSTAAPA
jgi:nitrogen-specific signal transduction histidine kinase